MFITRFSISVIGGVDTQNFEANPQPNGTKRTIHLTLWVYTVSGE